MLNPDTGKEGDYEEVWASVEPTAVGNSSHLAFVVLQFESEDTKGLVVLLGQYCQGFIRQGGQLAAERWEWSNTRGWKRTVLLGNDQLPCSKVLNGTVPKVEEEIIFAGLRWKAIESSA